MKLLKEIILVDDNSDEGNNFYFFLNRILETKNNRNCIEPTEELKGTLTYYVRTYLPLKVELIRLPQREGIVRSRLEGAKYANGEVLVFLDAHCEVIKEW